MFYEKWPRSLVKVVSWRVTVTLSNFLGAWWTSGSMAAGLGFAGFALVMNSTLYFIHERAWNKVDQGKVAKNNDV
jgi:uncharacterized membrane protein